MHSTFDIGFDIGTDEAIFLFCFIFEGSSDDLTGKVVKLVL